MLFGHETVINQISTTQLVQLRAGVLTPGQPVTRARRKHARGRLRHGRVGDHDEAVSSRDVNLILRQHEQPKTIRLRSAEERWGHKVQQYCTYVYL